MITVDEITKLEDLSEEKGISKLQLMENAGYRLYTEITKKYGDRKYLIICGSGNNGGDGFVLAKHLKQNNYDVKILFVGEIESLKKESGFNFFFLKENKSELFTEDFNEIENSEIIVDAIIGIGIKGKIREPINSLIDRINKSNKIVIAVDCPTGINPDTGEIIDKYIKFDLIMTFHDIKKGLVEYKDKTHILGIGL